MIKEKNKVADITPIETVVTETHEYEANPMMGAYEAVRTILEGLHEDPDDDTSPRLFKTIKLDNGQLARVKKSTQNLEYPIAFPAVFIHFINVYYNVDTTNIAEGKGVMRIHYILNRLNNSDDDVEGEGFTVFGRINAAIQAHMSDFPALVTKFQLAYWDMPLTFDNGLQPFWIDYTIWFNDYSGYREKNYIERYLVIPPFTNHGDQEAEYNQHGHSNHTEPTFDEASTLEIPE